MSIKNIEINNFTVFNDIDIEFSDGINVIIGENGTGKTHLMKSMYSMSKNSKDRMDLLNDYFPSKSDYDFISDKSKPLVLTMGIEKGGKSELNGLTYINGLTMNHDDNLNIRITGNKNQITKVEYTNKEIITVYIPAKDILTHSEGFVSLFDERYIPFDKSYKDIVSKSLLTNLKKTPVLGEAILPKIEKIIDGKVSVENEVFYIEKSNGAKVQFSLEAEGVKKIAILWKLIMNGSITKGSVLFWDEPEANINPKLLRDVAEILLELSRNGVQIFIASHNYVLAKYIEVLMKDSDEVSFHSLYKTENDGVKCESNRNFRDLEHNSIISSFDKLLDEVFDLNIGD